MERAAPTRAPVLLRGEGGTGKDAAARRLHQLSARSEASFSKLSCPELAARQRETDLLVRGLGGDSGGTLFLDQVAELDLKAQAQLVAWLQEAAADPEGPPRPRLLASASGDLLAAMAAGRFRRDLFYHLSVIPLRLPPLRERREDLPHLTAHFLARWERRFGLPSAFPSNRVWRAWAGYDWPGNLRELENLVQRYVILGSEDALVAGLAPGGGEAENWLDGSASLRDLTRRAERRLERDLISQALQRSGGNRKQAAGLLRISYRALQYKMKNANLAPPASRRGARSEGGNL